MAEQAHSSLPAVRVSPAWRSTTWRGTLIVWSLASRPRAGPTGGSTRSRRSRLEAALPVELLCGAVEADVALLDQVEERHAEIPVATCDQTTEPQVRLDHPALCGAVTGAHPLGEPATSSAAVRLVLRRPALARKSCSESSSSRCSLTTRRSRRTSPMGGRRLWTDRSPEQASTHRILRPVDAGPPTACACSFHDDRRARFRRPAARS